MLTDFYKDPDDKQSMIRFLSYANELEIRGLIATSLAKGTGEVRPDLLKKIIDDYGRVRSNLLKHDKGYPTAKYLKGLVRAGAPVKRKWAGDDKGFKTPFGRDSRTSDPVWAHIGPGKDTPASKHIIKVVDESSRPTWIIVWGGPMDLAQAMWRVRNDRSARGLKKFVAKIRYYQISWQDPGAVWLWEKFPDMIRLQANELYNGMYEQGPSRYQDKRWVDNNIRNHGTFGGQYPEAGSIKGIKEGDSPSFLYLIRSGLNELRNPGHGSWGGRFKRWGKGTQYYVDARDRHPDGNGGVPTGSDNVRRNMWTVARWAKARNRDFAARLDWSVKSYGAANHNPVIELNGDRTPRTLRRIARAGTTVDLDARQTRDPDGDKLSYKWWQYVEMSSYKKPVDIKNRTSSRATFVAPSVKKTKRIHLILEVTDDGSPNLTRYRRVVVTVNP